MKKKLSVTKNEKVYSIAAMRFGSPSLNTQSKNLPAEKWKDIPGFEDEYELSNYGRLKSKDRWIDMGTYMCFRSGRIKKPVGANGFDLRMQLHKDKKRYYFSVGRFVYNLFVAQFNMDDHSFIVTRKNGDGLNCFYKNLQLRSISEVAKEGFAMGRRKSVFQLQIKPVTQYTLNGKKVRQFNSTKEAFKSTGINSEYINGAACTEDRTAGGFFWRYGKPHRHIDLSVYKIKSDFNKKSASAKKEETKRCYLYRSTEDMPGEKWKSVKGYEGAYEVSNYGRVKSLSRMRNYTSSLGTYASRWTRELLLKQSLRKSLNQYTGDLLKYLCISLKKEGKYKTFIVSRLVYQTFSAAKIILDKKAVIHKNGDNLDNHISNLRTSSLSEIYTESYRKKRRKSFFQK
jgi:hypothetical protein